MLIALGLMSNLSLGGMILVSLGNPFLVLTPFSLLGITSMEISKGFKHKKAYRWDPHRSSSYLPALLR